MKLLVITSEQDRAEEWLDDLAPMDVAIEYLAIRHADWEGDLYQVLVSQMEERHRELAGKQDASMETACNGRGIDRTDIKADAVLLFVDREEAVGNAVRSLRERIALPLVVCSGKESYYQELQCLQAGADDYQGFRCPPMILLLRLYRLMQLYQGKPSGIMTARGLVENPEVQQFYYDNVSLALTKREYQVLYWLIHSQEEIVPKGKLLYHIWERDTPQASRALDTVIKQLRRKLSATPVEIQTCYGRGYSLRDHSSAADPEGTIH